MRILVTGTNTRAVTRQKNHMIPYQDTCIRFMKTAEPFPMKTPPAFSCVGPVAKCIIIVFR